MPTLLSAHRTRSLPGPGPASALIVFALAALGASGAAGEIKLEVGEAPPEMAWQSVAGDTLSWGDLQGDGPLVMVFWATWCKACKKEWPKLQEISARYAEGDRRPAWASVSLGEPADRVARVAGERNLPGTVLYDPKEENGKLLGIDFVPTVCILDSGGRVAYKGPPRIKAIDRLLARLTAESAIEGEEP